MPLKCAVQAISHICIQGAIQSVAEGTRVAASCAPWARDVTRGGHPPTLRMSPRPVLGGAAPVAADAPAPHVLRAHVVDRDRPARLASGSAHPGRSGEKRPIPARTAVVLGDDATSGADVQTNALLGRRADRRVMAGYDGPLVDAFLHTPGSAATTGPTRATTSTGTATPAWRASCTAKKHGLIARPAQRTRRSREQLPTSRDRAHRRRSLMYLARQPQAECP